MPNNELAKTTNQTLDVFDPAQYDQMMRVADVFIKSGAMPAHIKNVAQLMLIFQHGRDMGMSPTEAISSLYIVNGAVTIWGRAMIARLTRAGYKISYKDGDCDTDKAWCEATVTTPEGETLTQRYTYRMAVTSIRGIASRPGWIVGQNRLLKLRYGAINIILKTYLAHLLYGANGLTDIDGEVARVKEPTPPKSLPQLDADSKVKQAAVDKLASGETTWEIIKHYYAVSPALEEQVNAAVKAKLQEAEDQRPESEQAQEGPTEVIPGQTIGDLSTEQVFAELEVPNVE